MRRSSEPLGRLTAALDEELLTLRDRHVFREPVIIEASDGARIRIGGRWVLNCASNDYLGLSDDARVIRAAQATAMAWGVGAKASRLLAGSTRVHQDLERELAQLFQAEACVVFGSGYLANLGALHALANDEDFVVVDRLAHASLIDACRATRATLRVFHHNDPEHLRAVLRQYPRGRRRLVVTEGLFSMDGDRAPLAELVRVAESGGACVYLDDAHGVFATGQRGLGTIEQEGVSVDRVILMGTLGKALGAQGGFVVGSETLIRAVQNRARTFIYSTALATPIAAAALEALRIVREQPELRRRLATAVRQFQASRGTRQPASHIIPMVVGTSNAALTLAHGLWDRGIFAPAVRPPTVPEGTARIRISLTTQHTADQLTRCAKALSELSTTRSSRNIRR